MRCAIVRERVFNCTALCACMHERLYALCCAHDVVNRLLSEMQPESTALQAVISGFEWLRQSAPGLLQSALPRFGANRGARG